MAEFSISQFFQVNHKSNELFGCGIIASLLFVRNMGQGEDKYDITYEGARRSISGKKGKPTSRISICPVRTCNW